MSEIIAQRIISSEVFKQLIIDAVETYLFDLCSVMKDCGVDEETIARIVAQGMPRSIIQTPHTPQTLKWKLPEKASEEKKRSLIVKEAPSSSIKADRSTGSAGSSEPADENTITVVLNYGGENGKSHALYGDFKERYKTFKDEYLIKTKFISYNRSLAYGPGWIMKKDLLEQTLQALKKANIPFRQVENSEYEEEFRSRSSKQVSDSKPKAKLPEKDSKGKEPESESEEEKVSTKKSAKPSKDSKSISKPPKGKKVESESEDEEPVQTSKSKSQTKTKETKNSAPPKPITPKTVKNEWGNREDKETGIIFCNLPIGKKGTNRAVAVGWQDIDTKAKGLDSVIALNEDHHETCRENGWLILTQDMIIEIRKIDPKLAKSLQGVMNRVTDENNDEESEKSESDEESEGESESESESEEEEE
jgi:hypothetical protein